MKDTAGKVTRLITAQGQANREGDMALRVFEAIGAYCRAGDTPATPKDAVIITRILKNIAAITREEIGLTKRRSDGQ